jgi:hypothetical protein
VRTPSTHTAQRASLPGFAPSWPSASRHFRFHAQCVLSQPTLVHCQRMPALNGAPIESLSRSLVPHTRTRALTRVYMQLVPRLRCVQATRRADVLITHNGTASIRATRSGNARWQLHYHWPPVHHKVFAVGPLEVAILASHLRAIGMGKASGEKAFVVFEEDAEWAMLLGVAHDAVGNQIAAMPRHWSVLQAAVIAETAYLRHLHRRLSVSAGNGLGGGSRGRLWAAPTREHQGQPQPPQTQQRDRRWHAGTTAPIVPRSTLRGLSWPFTPGREVVDNATWLKPYWSAACYVVSARGAGHLLNRYWPSWPRHAGVVVDTRSQRWPAADQLIFNLSRGVYLTPPLLTQPVFGAHTEHTKYKRGARDFVFSTWRRSWQALADADLTRVPISVFALSVNLDHRTKDARRTKDVLGSAAGGSSSRSALTRGGDSAGAASMTSAYLLPTGGGGLLALCHDVLASLPTPSLPAHTSIRAENFGRAVDHALALAAKDLAEDGTLLPGAPSHALLLSIPVLRVHQGAEASSSHLHAGGIADRIVQASLRLLLPHQTNGSALDGGASADAFATPQARGAKADIVVLTMPSMPSMATEQRTKGISRRLSCLMGVVVRRSMHLRRATVGASARCSPCAGMDVAGILVRAESAPSLLRALRKRPRGQPRASGDDECAVESFSALLSLASADAFTFAHYALGLSASAAITANESLRLMPEMEEHDVALTGDGSRSWCSARPIQTMHLSS